MIDVLVERDDHGRWWAYVSAFRNGDRGTIGRRFKTSCEAAKWGLTQAERISRKQGERDNENLSR